MEEQTYDLLIRLFEQDPRLSKTKPKREYHVDQQRLARWMSLAEPYLKDQMRYIEYHFDEWLHALANCIDRLIDTMSQSACSFLVSTGIDPSEASQSASELWLFYIFRRVAEKKGWEHHSVDRFWESFSITGEQATCHHVVFIDDFVRSGIHLSGRIAGAPDLATFLLDQHARIHVLAPIMTTRDTFENNFLGVVGDIFSSGEDPESQAGMRAQEMARAIYDRFILIFDIEYDSEKYPYVLFDHNSGEKYDSELFYGFYGDLNKRLGSLIEGANPLNNERYPPPLYHLEFGNGKIPKNQHKLVRIPGTDFYDRDEM
jgi:hypothetical protein